MLQAGRTARGLAGTGRHCYICSFEQLGRHAMPAQVITEGTGRRVPPAVAEGPGQRAGHAGRGRRAGRAAPATSAAGGPGKSEACQRCSTPAAWSGGTPSTTTAPVRHAQRLLTSSVLWMAAALGREGHSLLLTNTKYQLCSALEKYAGEVSLVPGWQASLLTAWISAAPGTEVAQASTAGKQPAGRRSL